MKVHCDEGIAIHVAPDPCAGVREDVGEASAGERMVDLKPPASHSDSTKYGPILSQARSRSKGPLLYRGQCQAPP